MSVASAFAATFSALDYSCPACNAKPDVACTPRWENEVVLPGVSRDERTVVVHRARVAVAEIRATEDREQKERRRTRARLQREALVGCLSDADRLLGSLEVREGDWPLPEIDAAGIFIRRSRLFMPGDAVVLSFTNGGGTRCGAVGWSTKKRCVVGPLYIKFSACQYTSGSYFDHQLNVAWVPLPKDLKYLDEERLGDPPFLHPDVREFVTRAVEGCRRAYSANR